MGYKHSQLDKSNLDWFEKDASKQTLVRMRIHLGAFRGLRGIEVHFKYPITVISGKNGTGKSTLLACAACAYHNSEISGFTPYLRQQPYYTPRDFFVQSTDEPSPTGYSIGYQFLLNYWRKTKALPSGIGLNWHYRNKSFSTEKWGRYSSRVERNVVYLGIERIVPHIETSVSKSYRRKFKTFWNAGYEEGVRKTVGRIIGRTYEDFYYRWHSKYRLPFVKSGGQAYSGFNMGAGEKALFEIFSTIYSCRDNLLLVIDEIELGLHEEAQIRLIEELKKICGERHIQIICTSHSPRVLNNLPPEARLHLEKEAGVVRVIPEISADYAAGLMSGVKHAELAIICEDGRAKNILTFALPNEIRQRVEIIPIGSAAAVMRYMAFRKKDKSLREACCFLDGDQTSSKQTNINSFFNALEQVTDKEEARRWIEKRLNFLPGTTNPEKWVISKRSNSAFKKLAGEFRVTINELNQYLGATSLADNHDEFYELAKRLNQDVSVIETRFVQCALEKSKPEVRKIIEFVSTFLAHA